MHPPIRSRGHSFPRALLRVGTFLCFGLYFGCDAGPSDENRWAGTVDTLPSGRILVDNPAIGVWDSSAAWRVEEEVRIGTLEGSGPELFGDISALEVDQLGRVFVFESQTQELRVFDTSGRHVRTIGREGEGPGEFKQGLGMAWSPEGHLWVVDPGNMRIAVFDTAGAYLTNHRIQGGYVMHPWPGGFDNSGMFYHPGIDLAGDLRSRFVLVRFDAELNPIDTVRIPRLEGDGNFFELRSEGGVARYGIPFSAGITWRLAPTGHIWFANTGDYRIYQRTVEGDTVRVVSREFQPVPVTDEELEDAVEGLQNYVRRGGRVDRSRIPRTKPVLLSLYLDEENGLWIAPTTATEDNGRLLDVFDAEGRYQGRVSLPFVLRYPDPIFRHNAIYAVTRDEFDVPYVVIARIEKP